MREISNHPTCSFAGKNVQFAALNHGRKRARGITSKMNIVVHMLRVAVLLIGGAVAASGAAAQSVQELDRSLLFPSNADIADGEKLAAEACGDCHRLNGISINPTFAHLAGQHVIYLYNELLAYQRGDRDDESMSSAVEFLSDEALRKVAVYYASLAPPQPVAPATTAGRPAASDPVESGKSAAASCAGCHGENGNSQIPGMPSLTA